MLNQSEFTSSAVNVMNQRECLLSVGLCLIVPTFNTWFWQDAKIKAEVAGISLTDESNV